MVDTLKMILPSEGGMDLSNQQNTPELPQQNPVDVIASIGKPDAYGNLKMETPSWQIVKEARAMVGTIDDPEKRSEVEAGLTFFENSYEQQFQKAIDQVNALGTPEFSGLDDADIRLLEARKDELHPSLTEKIGEAAQASEILRAEQKAARVAEREQKAALAVEKARGKVHEIHVDEHPEGQHDIIPLNNHRSREARERSNAPTVMTNTVPSNTTPRKKGLLGRFREAVGL